MNLYDKLIQYAGSDYYPFHMPGHKRNRFCEEPSPYWYDITEIDGFDNLHDAEDIIKQGMEEAASIYGTKNTYYLVNGSTCGLLAAISAATNPGDRVLVARNCHKAVYNAVMLRQLQPVYLYPKMLAEYNLAGVVTPEDVQAAFRRQPDITAVILTSPTYDGIVSDIESIAKIVHGNGSILIVDEAHGAHFPFSKLFPDSAIKYGADLVIQSLHKTLPALTQTALLHQISERVSERKLRQYLGIYQSSSPSYVLMGSIARCLEYLTKCSHEFEEYEKRLTGFYEGVKHLKNIVVMKDVDSPWIYKDDISKLRIFAKSNVISGVWIYEQLVQRYHIQPEMMSKDYVICLSSVCDTQKGFDRLRYALYELDLEAEQLSKSDSLKQAVSHTPKEFLQNDIVYLPYEVETLEQESRPLFECENQIAAQYIYLYPPGIPLVVPGERISRKLLDQLLEYRQVGLHIKGISDDNTKQFDIIKENA